MNNQNRSQTTDAQTINNLENLREKLLKWLSNYSVMDHAFFSCFVHADSFVLRHIFSNVTTADQLRHLAKFSCTFFAMFSSSEDGETATRGCSATFEIVYSGKIQVL